MGCVGRLLLATLTTTVATTMACPLPRVGDPGVPFYELSVLLEDDVAGEAASQWATPQGPDRVVTEHRTDFGNVFAIYESAPDRAFVDGVARLDVFVGEPEDIEHKDDDDAARARIAVTRTTLWLSERTWRDVDAAAVPFDLAALDNDEVFGAEFLDRTRSVVLFVDNAIAGARRCGDDAEATCPAACDIVTGDGDAACCRTAHDALMDCEALVVSDGGVARLHRAAP